MSMEMSKSEVKSNNTETKQSDSLQTSSDKLDESLNKLDVGDDQTTEKIDSLENTSIEKQENEKSLEEKLEDNLDLLENEGNSKLFELVEKTPNKTLVENQITLSEKLDLSKENVNDLVKKCEENEGKSLEPNKTYEIDGMRISTDDNGNVYKVNDKFVPNNEYVLNGNEYMTNDKGERFPKSPEGYKRPNLRVEVKKDIYDNAPKDKEGRYLDPNTGNPIKDKPDIGHKPGHEHWREAKKAYEEGISQEEFNERMNNPDYYQLEDPSSNRSHKYEDKSEYEGE